MKNYIIVGLFIWLLALTFFHAFTVHRHNRLFLRFFAEKIEAEDKDDDNQDCEHSIKDRIHTRPRIVHVKPNK